jgi:hypothetical protein
MITLFCITAFTMLVTEAAGKESGKELCLCPFAGKCLCDTVIILLRGNPARVTSESEADLATLAAAARRDESLKVVEIVARTNRAADVVRKKLINSGVQPDRIKRRSDIDLNKVDLGGDVAVLVPTS